MLLGSYIITTAFEIRFFAMMSSWEAKDNSDLITKPCHAIADSRYRLVCELLIKVMAGIALAIPPLLFGTWMLLRAVREYRRKMCRRQVINCVVSFVCDDLCDVTRDFVSGSYHCWILSPVL